MDGPWAVATQHHFIWSIKIRVWGEKHVFATLFPLTGMVEGLKIWGRGVKGTSELVTQDCGSNFQIFTSINISMIRIHQIVCNKQA